jgi:hypothetical protein
MCFVLYSMRAPGKSIGSRRVGTPLLRAELGIVGSASLITDQMDVLCVEGARFGR